MWNPDKYEGIMKVRLPSQHIWLPDIVLYNKWAFSTVQFGTQVKGSQLFLQLLHTFYKGDKSAHYDLLAFWTFENVQHWKNSINTVVLLSFTLSFSFSLSDLLPAPVCHSAFRLLLCLVLGLNATLYVRAEVWCMHGGFLLILAPKLCQLWILQDFQGDWQQLSDIRL